MKRKISNCVRILFFRTKKWTLEIITSIHQTMSGQLQELGKNRTASQVSEGHVIDF